MMNNNTTESTALKVLAIDPSVTRFSDHFIELLMIMYIPLVAIGVIGNCLILLTFSVFHKLRTISNAFVVVLSIADANVAVFVGLATTLTMSEFGKLSSDVENNGLWCQFTSNLRLTGIMSSTLSTMLICFHRYIRLARSNETYCKYFGRKWKVYGWCAFPFAVGCLINLHFDAMFYWPLAACMDDLFRHSLNLCIYVIAYVTTNSLYYFTFRRLRGVQRKAMIFSSVSRRQALQEKTRTMNVSLLCSLVNIHLYLPFLFLSTVVTFPNHSLGGVTSFHVTVALSQWLCVLGCAANCVVYGWLNTNYRRYLWRALRCLGSEGNEGHKERSGSGARASVTSMMSVRLSTLKRRISKHSPFQQQGDAGQKTARLYIRREETSDTLSFLVEAAVSPVRPQLPSHSLPKLASSPRLMLTRSAGPTLTSGTPGESQSPTGSLDVYHPIWHVSPSLDSLLRPVEIVHRTRPSLSFPRSKEASLHQEAPTLSGNSFNPVGQRSRGSLESLTDFDTGSVDDDFDLEDSLFLFPERYVSVPELVASQDVEDFYRRSSDRGPTPSGSFLMNSRTTLTSTPPNLRFRDVTSLSSEPRSLERKKEEEGEDGKGGWEEEGTVSLTNMLTLRGQREAQGLAPVSHRAVSSAFSHNFSDSTFAKSSQALPPPVQVQVPSSQKSEARAGRKEETLGLAQRSKQTAKPGQRLETVPAAAQKVGPIRSASRMVTGRLRNVMVTGQQSSSSTHRSLEKFAQLGREIKSASGKVTKRLRNVTAIGPRSSNSKQRSLDALEQTKAAREHTSSVDKDIQTRESAQKATESTKPTLKDTSLPESTLKTSHVQKAVQKDTKLPESTQKTNHLQKAVQKDT